MKIKDGMYLYHGSYAPVNEIDLNYCAQGKDFGKGFYLTDNLDQAKKFISTSLKKAKAINKISSNQNYGYVSIFKYKEPKDNIRIYEFETTNKEWLWFVSMNRKATIAKYFKDNLNSGLLNSEIIVGKVANDTTNPTIAAYINGLYGEVKSESAINFAINQLMPDRLNDQYCFLTEKAISCLELVEVIKYE